MLRETVLAWQDYYTIREVAQCFSIEVPGLNMPLIGELDCVVTDGKDTCIVDWKTSASKWPSEKADKDLQATIYTYAYKQMNGILPLFRFDVVTKTKTPSVENHYTRGMKRISPVLNSSPTKCRKRFKKAYFSRRKPVFRARIVRMRIDAKNFIKKECEVCRI